MMDGRRFFSSTLENRLRYMPSGMAEESGVETPTIDDLIRLDRGRKGKKLSNEDWMSHTYPVCCQRTFWGNAKSPAVL